jgi:hypothetical protein
MSLNGPMCHQACRPALCRAGSSRGVFVSGQVVISIGWSGQVWDPSAGLEVMTEGQGTPCLPL